MWFCVKHFQRDHFLLDFHISSLVSPQSVIFSKTFSKGSLSIVLPYVSPRESSKCDFVLNIFKEITFYWASICLASWVLKVWFCVKHFQRSLSTGLPYVSPCESSKWFCVKHFQRDHFLLGFHMSCLMSYQSVILCKTFSKTSLSIGLPYVSPRELSKCDFVWNIFRSIYTHTASPQCVFSRVSSYDLKW